jgi:mono/diheme cytochrome c family protein
MKSRRLTHAWAYATASALALAIAAAPSPDAQTPQKTIWDGVYTREQAERGKSLYTGICGRCHGANLIGGEVAGEVAPDLKGVYFVLRWSDTLSNLFIKVEDTMPKDDPGSVSPEETAEIIAYLLQSNDAPAGRSELPHDRDQVKGILVTKKPN